MYNFNKHISGQFNLELEYIRTEVMKMGGFVEQQITDALNAIHQGDELLAARVIDNDKKVNQFEMDIDQACLKIIAKRQPAASDLRLIITIIKILSELERIGDSAKQISQMAIEKLAQNHQSLIVSLESLGRHSLSMLHDVLDAFARMDLQEALRIYADHKKNDQEYEAIIRQLMTYMMEDPRSIPSVMTALWGARSIQRISDRSQNICEFIIFFVEGQDVRHMSSEEINRLLKNSEF